MVNKQYGKVDFSGGSIKIPVYANLAALQAAKPNNTTNLADELAMVGNTLYKWNSSTPAWETFTQLSEVDMSNFSDYRASTFSFTASTKTIADSANGFVTANFKSGQQIVISGSASNNGTFTIVSVSAGSIVVAETLVNESAGAYVKIVTVVTNKLVKTDQNGNIKGYTKSKEEFTASGAISAFDSVYVSAANTAKTVYPTAMGTGASIATSPTNTKPCRLIQISNNVILHINGNDAGAGGSNITAQVRTLNAAETDFSYGTEATVLATPSNWFDACQIDTNTFAIIYQKNSAGSPAGIQVVILTVSGTTITVGTPTTIETTGSLNWYPTICKVDTLKCLITYMKDSDSKPYVQVLTVSGTTITTNTPVNLKNTTNAQKCASCQLSTGRVVVVYADSSTSIFGRTIDISGTTPTINAEQTVDNTFTGYNDVSIQMITPTKCLMSYFGNSTGQVAIITLSGAGNNTITRGAITTPPWAGGGGGGVYRGISMIGTGYALMCGHSSSTVIKCVFYSIGATSLTQISSQDLASSAATYMSTAIAKISPWTYLVTGTLGNSDYVVKMTPISNRIGIAESAIPDTSLGLITLRFQTAVLSGLTAGSQYYVDDNAQPTANSSLTAPILGVAISTTKLLLT